jgi:hypothetical protein
LSDKCEFLAKRRAPAMRERRWERKRFGKGAAEKPVPVTQN